MGYSKNSSVFINYVGQATHINDRLSDEFKDIQRFREGKRSSLIDVDKFLKSGFMDIVYVPDFNYEPSPKLVKDNTDKHTIYYAIMKTILKDSNLENVY